MNSTSAHIQEIFSSIQGEGIYVGEPQIFVRFAQCNIWCKYCDTPLGRESKEPSLKAVMERIKRLEAVEGPHHSISVTGGEPLIHVVFLKLLLPELKNAKFTIYLETNGTLPLALKEVVSKVDIIAMDIKLPSSTGGKGYWTEHQKFLEIANQKRVFVKVVVTPKTDTSDLKKAMKIVKGVNSSISFVIQPVTPHGSIKKTVQLKALLNFEKLAKRDLRDVRVIPQWHKLMGIR